MCRSTVSRWPKQLIKPTYIELRKISCFYIVLFWLRSYDNIWTRALCMLWVSYSYYYLKESTVKIIVKLSIVSQPKKMSSIRFIQITLLLALLMMNRLASPRAVDSGSKIDKGECVCSHRSLYFYYVGRPGNEPILISSDSINVLCFLHRWHSVDCEWRKKLSGQICEQWEAWSNRRMWRGLYCWRSGGGRRK